MNQREKDIYHFEIEYPEWAAVIMADGAAYARKEVARFIHESTLSAEDTLMLLLEELENG